MSTFLWILCALAYFTALVVLGMTTLRKGHTALFWFGILLPSSGSSVPSWVRRGRSPRQATTSVR